ncbi:MAG: hypothetical protein ACR2NZ_18380 [Rubripirellula sp.]
MAMIRKLMMLILALGFVGYADADTCQVRVVLYVPSDVDVPDYQHRLDQTIAYADAFFREGIKRWGHDEPVSPFRIDRGHAEVLLVQGERPSSKCTDPSIRKEAIASARRQLSVSDDRQIWWVFVYRGDPPTRFANYRGGFEPAIGGWSVCNFDTRPGDIQIDDPLGNAFLSELTLKGMIHELGHAFQLPHIGPRTKDRAGNTLMGPTHANYRRIVPRRESRVYLSEAAAAMIVNHPAFRGTPDDRGALPKIRVSNQQYKYDRARATFMVSGRIEADKEPSFAIVADESKARPGEYWTKHYVSPVDAEGRYHVLIDELPNSGGTLKTWFVFANGASTGNGRLRGKAGAIVKDYQREGRVFRFQ